MGVREFAKAFGESGAGENEFAVEASCGITVPLPAKASASQNDSAAAGVLCQGRYLRRLETG